MIDEIATEPDFKDAEAPATLAARQQAFQLIGISTTAVRDSEGWDALVQRLIEAEQVVP